MEKANTEDISIVILLIGTASGVFAGFCPSWFTVSSPSFHEQEAKAGNVSRIRYGEAAATAIVSAMGYAVTKTTGRKTPLLASIGICAVFVAGYEYMIEHPSKNDSQKEPGGILSPWKRFPKQKE